MRPGALLGPSIRQLKDLKLSAVGLGCAGAGGALDVGYQAILGDCVVLGVSAGAQYVYVDKALPDQNDLFSNASTQSALRPRASITLAYAF